MRTKELKLLQGKTNVSCYLFCVPLHLFLQRFYAFQATIAAVELNRLANMVFFHRFSYI